MKKLFSKILVLSLLLSGNALSEMPKFFGIVIGGTKAAELLKKDITFVKELKQLNYGTHKSYILDLKDPKSDYFYYFNYDTIKLNPKFQNSANIKGELGFRLWAEGKPLYDTYKDCNIYRNGFLKMCKFFCCRCVTKCDRNKVSLALQQNGATPAATCAVVARVEQLDRISATHAWLCESFSIMHS